MRLSECLPVCLLKTDLKCLIIFLQQSAHRRHRAVDEVYQVVVWNSQLGQGKRACIFNCCQVQRPLLFGLQYGWSSTANSSVSGKQMQFLIIIWLGLHHLFQTRWCNPPSFCAYHSLCNSGGAKQSESPQLTQTHMSRCSYVLVKHETLHSSIFLWVLDITISSYSHTILFIWDQTLSLMRQGCGQGKAVSLLSVCLSVLFLCLGPACHLKHLPGVHNELLRGNKTALTNTSVNNNNNNNKTNIKEKRIHSNTDNE